MRWLAFVLVLGTAGCVGLEERRAARADAAQEMDAARAGLWRLAENQRTLPRPLILLAGWNDDPVLWGEFRHWLARCATDLDGRVFAPDLRGPGGVKGAADRLAAQFEGLGEVDVVAHSVGGLVAREAARGERGAKRLKVVRLYTMGTPHAGTKWSKYHPILPLREQVADCAPGSEFLCALTADPTSCEMSICSCWAEGDIVITRASATAAGEEHRVYSQAEKHRVHEKSIRDPRWARDVIGSLLEEEGAGSGRRAQR